jgi:hypothetical protein
MICQRSLPIMNRTLECSTFRRWVDDHIIPLIEDFEARANAAQQAAFEQISATVNPECADESEVHEQAFDHGL